MCKREPETAFILLFLETMSTFVISPPKCGGNMVSTPLIFFFGAASVQATEPKRWVLERNYPLAKVAKQYLRTGKCFLRKPVRIQCTEHDSSWISYRGSCAILPMDLRTSGYALLTSDCGWQHQQDTYLLKAGPCYPQLRQRTGASGWVKGGQANPVNGLQRFLGGKLRRSPGENNPLDKCLLSSWSASVNKHTLENQGCAKCKLLIFSLRYHIIIKKITELEREAQIVSGTTQRERRKNTRPQSTLSLLGDWERWSVIPPRSSLWI